MKEYRPRLNQDQFQLVAGKPNYEKWIILPDPHRPFHNAILWNKVLKLAETFKHQIYGVILPGDYLDLYTLGSYNQDSLGLLTNITLPGHSTPLDLEQEYNDGKKGLAELYKVLPKGCKKVYIYGNHEDRYFREVNKRDNKKYGGALIPPHEALRLHENKWEVLFNWQEDSYKLGDHLEVTHGIFTNVHCSKKTMEEYQTSVIFGHTHRFSSFGAGKHIGYNIGWMGDPTAPVFKYMYKKARYNKWMNGFCFANIDSHGDFFVEPVQCYDNKFFYAGKIW